MLGIEVIEADCLAAARKMVKRGIALAKGDSVIKIGNNGKKIAETPDTALIDRERGGAALLPEPAKGACVGQLAAGPMGCEGPGVNHLIEAMTVATTKIAAYFGSGYLVAALRASELMCGYVHGYL
jgi:hypothetical protein